MRSSLLALAVALGALAAPAFTVKTSLYDLVGLDGEAAASVAEAKDVVLVVASDADAARAFVSGLSTDWKATGEATGGLSAEALEGCVTSEDEALLATPEGRGRLARRALRRYLASPVPPLFGAEADPFCLKEHVALAFAASTNAVLPIVLAPEVAGNIDRLVDVVGELRARAQAAGVKVTGVPVHTAISAGACKREIGWLSVISLVFIALLSIFVFRTVRWLPLLGASLLVSAGGGFGALVLCFPSVHILTLVFGTTVLGLVIDYSFHALLSREDRRDLYRKLLVSWATSEISFVPLILSSVVVLRQTAVFLAVALAVALGFVRIAYPRTGLRQVREVKVPRGLGRAVRPFTRIVALGALVVFGWALPLDLHTDPQALYRPPAELAATDRLVAARWEAAGEATDETRERIQALYREQGAAQAEALGLETLVAPGEGAGRPSPRAALTRLLEDLTRATSVGLAVALVLMMGVLVVAFRGAFVRRFLPSLLAIGGVIGIVGLTEGAVNLFHLIALFLLAGLSVDYTVFLQGTRRTEGGSVSPTACSLLTSIVGFGALAFVSFPVVRAFGVVLGAGLPIAYCAALALRRQDDEAEGVERAASPLGLELLYLFYRVFGLRALHGAAACVGATVWTFSKQVRASSPRLRKVVLFTRSLADKLVIMAEGRQLPSVTTDGSPDAEAFVADVRARRGVFVLSSHCGTVETLVALGKVDITFHAWTDMARTAVFTRFYLRHAKRQRVVLHPITEIGIDTSFWALDALERGDSLVMAGDWGRGAFRFAHALGARVYFAACVADGPLSYRAIIRRLPGETRAMEAAYRKVLDEVTTAYPDQWFEWKARVSEGEPT